MLGKRSVYVGDEDVFAVKHFFISLKVISELGFSAQFPWKERNETHSSYERKIFTTKEFFFFLNLCREKLQNFSDSWRKKLEFSFFLLAGEHIFPRFSRRYCKTMWKKNDLTEMFMTLKHYCIIIIVIIVCSVFFSRQRVVRKKGKTSDDIDSLSFFMLSVVPLLFFLMPKTTYSNWNVRPLWRSRKKENHTKVNCHK